MRAKGLLMALGFVLLVVLVAWLTGDKSPFAAGADAGTDAPPAATE
ncbi:hypothetical protein ENSA5_23960 [Enhygromyxa salina]|uniref:Uncharacterized protein n=1 Tax=Enhygromyxa salina TaxID=215803 RepID=A0A2S9YBF2_9BACT|nr:hypothetical protein [Enhygromyxa salina]PRQ02341.1 hypothetical protein ENSA5_23960 [Enhygromyxa salina]